MPNANEALDLYRAMTPAKDGLPSVGRSARALGVRIEGDFADIVPDDRGIVHPESGGMSVAPSSVWNVPNSRRPRGMGNGSTGPAGDAVFVISELAVTTDVLAVRADPVTPKEHALVHPSVPVLLVRYEAALADTRNQWRRFWP
jgi:hypothetical protein